MNRKLINDFIRKNQNLSRRELANKCDITISAVQQRERDLGLKREWKLPNKATLAEHIVEHKESEAKKETVSKLKQAVQGIADLEKRMSALLDIQKGYKIHRIAPYKAMTESEATVICLASDWHIEERVSKEKTNGMNEYSLAISKARATQFFQRLVKLVKKEQQDVVIKHIVLALLGDFITGKILLV